MRKFKSVYTDKLNESIKLSEDKIVNDYNIILKALMEDNKVTDFDQLSTPKMKSFNAKLNECFDVTIGLTEKGKNYLSNREMFLTESSTKLEKKKYFKSKLGVMLESKLYTLGLKEELYAIINDVYESVKANKLSDALSVDEIETCVCESVSEHIKNTLMKQVRNEVK